MTINWEQVADLRKQGKSVTALARRYKTPVWKVYYKTSPYMRASIQRIRAATPQPSTNPNSHLDTTLAQLEMERSRLNIAISVLSTRRQVYVANSNKGA